MRVCITEAEWDVTAGMLISSITFLSGLKASRCDVTGCSGNYFSQELDELAGFSPFHVQSQELSRLWFCLSVL